MSLLFQEFVQGDPRQKIYESQFGVNCLLPLGHGEGDGPYVGSI